MFDLNRRVHIHLCYISIKEKVKSNYVSWFPPILKMNEDSWKWGGMIIRFFLLTTYPNKFIIEKDNPIDTYSFYMNYFIYL